VLYWTQPGWDDGDLWMRAVRVVFCRFGWPAAKLVLLSYVAALGTLHAEAQFSECPFGRVVRRADDGERAALPQADAA
jgi:hypothetical protein